MNQTATVTDDEIKKTVVLNPEKALAAFDEYRAQLHEFRELSDKLAFDYRDPEGNKAARSHVHKLRLAKGAVERVRKAEKAVALAYGRAVDGEAKKITSELEEMISVHAEPIAAIEREEAERKDRIEARIARIASAHSGLSQAGFPTLDQIDEVIDLVARVDTEHDFDEFSDKAQKVKHEQLERLRAMREAMRVHWQQQAELERLRKAEAERIAQEAAERAEREAAEARERAEREKVEREARAERERAEKAERELEESRKAEEAAREREEKAAKQAREQALRERMERDEREKAEADRRRQDAERRGEVQGEIGIALCSLGVTPDLADRVASALIAGKIPHVKVQW